MSKRAPKIVILGDVKDAERAMDQLNRKVASAQGKLKKRLRKMGDNFRHMAGRAAAGLAMAGAAAVGASITLAAQFQDSMQKMVSLVGLSQETVDGMRDSILRLSGQTAKAPKELADAMFYITSAGLRGENAMDALTASAEASAAGLGDVQTIADAVTSAMNAYGAENLSASQATDVLLASVREGKLEASDLAGSLGKVIPVASQMGVTFDQVGASIATMSRIGIDADTGTTALRQMLMSLLKPSTDANKAFAEMGTSAAEMRKRIADEGLLPVLLDLSDRFDGNASAMARVFPNARALTGVLATVGQNSEEAQRIFASLAESTGATAKAFDDAETPALRMRKALAGLKAEGIEIGDKAVSGIADFAESLAVLAKQAEPAMIGATTTLAGVVDGLTYISLAAASAHDEQAAAAMRLIEANESLRESVADGDDATTALANSIAHLTRTGAVSADAIERLGKTAGVSDVAIAKATSAALDHNYAQEKQIKTLNGLMNASADWVIGLVKEKDTIDKVVASRIVLTGIMVAQARALYESGKATKEQIVETFGLGIASEVTAGIQRDAFQAALAASKGYDAAAKSADDAAGAVFANTNILGDNELAALQDEAAQQRLRDAFKEAGGAAGVTADAVLRLTRATAAQADPVYAAIAAAQAYRDKLAEVRKDGKVTIEEQLEVAELFSTYREAVLALGAGDMEAGMNAVAQNISDSFGIPFEDALANVRAYGLELGALDGRHIAIGIDYDTQMAGGKTPEGMSGGTVNADRWRNIRQLGLPAFAGGGVFHTPKPGGAGLAI